MSEYISKVPVNSNSIIIGNYIKYDALIEMNKVFAGSNANHVNIYIDLYHLMLRLYRNDIRLNSHIETTSYIINMCAHYREFYKKIFGCTSNIYLVLTNDRMIYSEKYIKEYNKDNNDKIFYADMIRKHMLKSIEKISEVIKYINNTYMIVGPFEVATMIYTNILDEYNNNNYDPNVIISTSEMNYMILPYVNTPTVIFTHSYYNNNLNFDVITAENCIFKFYSRLSNSPDKFKYIHPKFINIFYALTRHQCRSMRSFIQINKAVQALNRMSNRYPNSIISDIDILRDELEQYATLKDFNEFYDRYRAIDIIYQSYVYKTTQYYHMKKTNLVDLQDPDTLKLLNESYFKLCPLDLDRL